MQIGDTQSDNLTSYDTSTSQNCDKRDATVSSEIIQTCDTQIDNLANYNISPGCDIRNADTASGSIQMGDSQEIPQLHKAVI